MTGWQRDTYFNQSSSSNRYKNRQNELSDISTEKQASHQLTPEAADVSEKTKVPQNLTINILRGYSTPIKQEQTNIEKKPLKNKKTIFWKTLK